MDVVLRSAGRILASVDLPGQLLVKPDGLTAEISDEGISLDVPPRGTEGFPDALVGALPLVYTMPGSGMPAVLLLDVPPPPPFTAQHITEMWSAITASSIPMAASVSVQGRALGAAESRGYGFDPQALPTAIGHLASMSRRWPDREMTAIEWRPFEVRGGREDLRETDRRAGRLAGLPRPGRTPMPEMTARRLGSTVPWGSRRLATICSGLGQALRTRAGSDDGSQVLAIVDHVARRSLRYADGPDASISSWPHEARAAFRAVVRALVELAAAAGAGTEYVPLSDLWRLYETWVAVMCHDVLAARYGPAEAVEANWWACSWTSATGVCIRLHAQATISDRVDPVIAAGPPGFESISSDLRPDCLIALRSPAGDQTLICVDAKQRKSATGMTAADVTATASKYLWGIRHSQDRDRPGVTDTLIVSSAPVPAMFDARRSRIDAAFTLPSGGDATFDDKLLAALDRGMRTIGAG
jgi:hypothetical protein